MKRKLSSILLGTIFLVGLGILLYPIIGDLFSKNNQIQVINQYEKLVEDMVNEEISESKELAKEYNEYLIDNVVISAPFDIENQKKLSNMYKELLNINSGDSMGYIYIPKIDTNLAIYHGTDEEVLQKGVGHLENTSFPIGGEGTHTVLTAHTGLPSAKLFNDVHDLGKGDKFYLHVLRETLAYEVDQIKVVEPNDTSDIFIDSTKDYATLVTCTPYGVNSHRLLVRGIRISYLEEEKVSKVEAVNNVSSWGIEYKQALIIGMFGLIFLVAVVILVKWNTKRKKINIKRLK